MKYFRGLKISLVAKLVLAFVLVAVIPMLVASKITTELIADVVNRNIERWLGEATTYMRHSVEETHERLKAVSRLLDTRFDGKTTLNKREAAALSFMDIDALWLRDAEGGLLYATLPEGRIAEPLYPGALFSWVLMADGTRRVAVTSERAFTADDGKVRTLQLASWFSIDYSDSSASGPVIRVSSCRRATHSGRSILRPRTSVSTSRAAPWKRSGKGPQPSSSPNPTGPTTPPARIP